MGSLAERATQPVALQDRLAWEPLERLIRSRIDPDPETGRWRAADIGREIGVTRNMVNEYRRRGTINAARGDDFATTLGLHPNLIWGHDVWEGQTIDVEAMEEERKERARTRSRARRRRAKTSAARHGGAA